MRRAAVKKKEEPAPRIVETYKVSAKFADDIFCPSNAIEARFWNRHPSPIVDIQFTTTDGRLCVPEFQATWNNSDGRYDEEFDNFCQRKFGLSYKALRSVWIGRLGRCDNYWHWIKLK